MFTELYSLFYVNKAKIVPLDLTLLTPIAFAHESCRMVLAELLEACICAQIVIHQVMSSGLQRQKRGFLRHFFNFY